MNKWAHTLPALLLLASASAQAKLVINIYQDGPDVAAIGSGTVDTTGLTGPSNSSWGPTIEYDWTVIVGGASLASVTASMYSGIVGPDSIAPSGSQIVPNAVSGDRFGVFFGSSPNRLVLPVGYSSGDLLSGTAIYFNKTLADAGLTAGDEFAWTWGSGATADSAVISVNPPSVPLPGTAVLLAVALLPLAARRRRKAGAPTDA
jgi:hypothetical protein